MSQQTLGISNLGVSAELPTKTLSQVTFNPTSVTGSPQDVTDLTFTNLENDIDASLDLSTIASTVIIFRLIEKVDVSTDEQIKEFGDIKFKSTKSSIIESIKTNSEEPALRRRLAGLFPLMMQRLETLASQSESSNPADMTCFDGYVADLKL